MRFREEAYNRVSKPGTIYPSTTSTYATSSLIVRTGGTTVTSRQETALLCTFRFAKDVICPHREGDLCVMRQYQVYLYTNTWARYYYYSTIVNNYLDPTRHVEGS